MRHVARNVVTVTAPIGKLGAGSCPQPDEDDAFGRLAAALRQARRKPQARTYDAMIAAVGPLSRKLDKIPAKAITAGAIRLR